jgi:hypothetical protein
MNSTAQTMQHPARNSAFRWIASSSAMEAIVAIAVIALSIVGLAGVNPLMLAAIAAIIAGAAVLIEGGAFHAFVTRSTTQSRVANAGLSASFLGALTGMILGILALMNVVPMTLLAITVLVYGVTFLLSGSANIEGSTFMGASDGFVLLGLSVTVLGLLAVIGVNPATLVLVGLLVLGLASLMGGSAKGLQAGQSE